MMKRCPARGNDPHCLLELLASGQVSFDDGTFACRECDCTIDDLEQQVFDVGNRLQQAAHATANSFLDEAGCADALIRAAHVLDGKGSGRDSDKSPSADSAANGDFDETVDPAASGDTSIPNSSEAMLQIPNLPGYRILRRLGAGGMGVVWQAIELSTKREVAVKTMSVAAFGSESGRLRFEREVELSARLEHPHIARLYGSGRNDTTCFYALELINGGRLDEVARQRHLTDREVVALVVKISLAVQHAHERGVIHRDLKPSNILVDEANEPHVLDFGLAKAILDDEIPDHALVTQEGVVAGTPAFMAPEQAAGRVREIDTRTDVYALGVILYRLLTGESPHSLAGSRFELLRRIIEEEVRRPRDAQPGLHVELEAILLKALSKDRAGRYRTAGELADDLTRFLAGDAIEAHVPTKLYFVRKRLKKYRLAFSAATVVLASVIGATAFYVRSIRIEQENTQREFERAETNGKRLAAKAVEAQQNAAEAIAAKELEERQTYWTTMQLVQERLKRDETSGLTRMLWDTKPHLRHWEWGYFMSQLQQPSWVLQAHEGPIQTIAVSPDESLLATCAMKELAVWDLATRELRWRQEGRSVFTQLQFEPSGRFLAASHWGVILIYDLKTGDVVKSLPVSGTQLIGFSPDGSHLYHADQGFRMRRENRLICYRTSDWQEVASAPLDKASAAIAVDLGGKYVAVVGGGNDGTDRVFDARTLDLVAEYNGTWSDRANALFDSNRGVLVTQMGGSLGILQFRDNQVTPDKTIAGDIVSVAWDKDGKDLFAGNRSGHIVCAKIDGSVTGTIDHGEGLRSIALLADSQLLSAGRRGQVKCWEISTAIDQRKVTKIAFHRLGRSGGSTCLALRDDGAQVICTGFKGHRHIYVLADVATRRQVVREFTECAGDSCAFGSFLPGTSIFVMAVSGEIRFYDTSEMTWRLERTLPVRQAVPSMLVVDAQGAHLAVTFADRSLEVYDLASGQLLKSPPNQDFLVHVALSDNGQRGVARLAKGHALVWNVATGQVVREIVTQRGFYSVALSPDGEAALLGTTDGDILVWDLRSDAAPTTLSGHREYVTVMMFSPDGKRLLTAGHDNFVRIWDWQLGRELAALPQGNQVYAVAITPDCRTIASTPGAEPSVALPWDVHENDPHFFAEALRIRQDSLARAVVEQLYKEHKQQDIVLEHLHADQSISRSVREKAVRLVEARGEDAPK